MLSLAALTNARRHIRPGDVAQYHPGTLAGRLIADQDPAYYSHTAGIVESMGELCVAQAQWGRPVAISSLDDEVRSNRYRIDIWRPYAPADVRVRAAELLVAQTGADRRYPKGALFRACLIRMPLVKLAVGCFKNLALDPAELPSAEEPKFCIELVDWAYRAASAELRPDEPPFALVPGKHVRDTAPSDLAHAATAKLLYTGLYL